MPLASTTIQTPASPPVAPAAQFPPSASTAGATLTRPPRPGTLRHVALQQFYRSLTAPSFEPGTTSWDHVSPDQRADWIRQQHILANLTPETVIAQARDSLAFHQAKEIDVAATLDAIREGRSGHRESARPVMIDQTSKLLAHHRSEIARISAGIDGLVGVPTTLAAE